MQSSIFKIQSSIKSPTKSVNHYMPNQKKKREKEKKKICYSVYNIVVILNQTDNSDNELKPTIFSFLSFSHWTETCVKDTKRLDKSSLPRPIINKEQEKQTRTQTWSLPYLDSSMESLRLQDWDTKSLSSCLDSSDLETESSSASRKDKTVNLSARWRDKRDIYKCFASYELIILISNFFT